MAGKLQREIKQSKPFASREAEAFLNLQRTADFLVQGSSEALKPTGLSPSQYNILRILRGAGPEGLACREIGERMVTRDPDMTRLLDRIEQRGLVQRSREQKDRRVVTVRITPQGLDLLKGLDKTVQEVHRKQFRKLDERRIRLLVELLESLRE